MEELLQAEGGQLGLNIVCEQQPVAPRPKKRLKKYNKYEKRRAKARKAKGLDVFDRKHENGVINKPETVEQDVKKDNIDEEQVNIESDEQDEPGKETGAPLNEPAQHDDDDQQDTVIASPPQHQPQQPAKPPSRKIHADSFQNEEERARYMREFHARPMEMDRRSGASSTILPSKESSHLFERNDNDDSVFASSLHSRLVSSLTKMGVTQPTIIQTRAIQALQSHSNCNLFIQSETGSGKSLAYLLPILQVCIRTLLLSCCLSDSYIWLRHDFTVIV